MKNIEEQVDLFKQKLDILDKNTSFELSRIAEAFNKMSNVIDLVYLEVAVLLEILSKKEIINEEQFTQALKDTSDKVEKEIQKRRTELFKPEVKKDKEKIETTD